MSQGPAALGRTVRRLLLASATVRVAWYRPFHTVRFSPAPESGMWVATLDSQIMQGLARLVHDWLRTRGASNIRWLAKGATVSTRWAC